MEEKIEWFCGIRRKEVDEEYKKDLERLNNWYLKETRSAYDLFCFKEWMLCEKEKITYDELRSIIEEFRERLYEIFLMYKLQEGESYCKCFMRKRDVTLSLNK